MATVVAMRHPSAHQPSTDHSDHRAHGSGHDGTAHQQFLDLDVEVFGDQLTAALDLATTSTATHVVDVGAGSGAGSRMLRQRFPEATLTCLDHDPQMLATLREQGFTALDADLDAGFPDLTSTNGNLAPAPDLVWAASSLHHVAHPVRLLTGIRGALAPGGTLVVVELSGLPRFLTDSPQAQLEQRLHALAAAQGWNHYPDWTPVIESAGFTVHKHELLTPVSSTAAARRYAHGWLSRLAGLTDITPRDRDDLEGLLPRVADDLPLTPVAARTAWVATPLPT